MCARACARSVFRGRRPNERSPVNRSEPNTHSRKNKSKGNGLKVGVADSQSAVTHRQDVKSDKLTLAPLLKKKKKQQTYKHKGRVIQRPSKSFLPLLEMKAPEKED